MDFNNPNSISQKKEWFQSQKNSLNNPRAISSPQKRNDQTTRQTNNYNESALTLAPASQQDIEGRGVTAKENAHFNDAFSRLEKSFLQLLQEEVYNLLDIPEQIKQFGYEQFSRESANLPPTELGLPRKPSPPARTINPNFSLIPGDSIQISTFGNSDLSFEAIVDAKGKLFLPKVGVVQVAGLPFHKAEALIKEKVTKLYVGSKVYVQLLFQNERTVSVFGKVGRPGTRTLSGMSTLMDALAESGGVLRTGSLRNIRIQYGGHSRQIDLYGALTGRGEGLLLRGGEVIHVPPIGPTVALVGEVLEPGIYETLKGESLAKFLQKVAHPTPLANSNSINIFRSEGDDQKVHVISSNRKDNERNLKAYDVVSIPSRVHETGRLVSILGAIKSPGSYESYVGQTLQNLIQKAGGLTRLHGNRVQIKRFLKLPRYQSAHGSKLTRINHKILDVPLIKKSLNQTLLTPGDEVFILQQEPDLMPAEIIILGEVSVPGSYPFMDGLNLHQLLTKSGGITENANIDAVTISRYNKEGQVEIFLKENTIDVLDVELKGIILNEGDVVTVPTKAKQGILVKSEGEFLRPGIYHLPKGARISDLISISGGFTNSAFAAGAGFFRNSVAKTFNQKMSSLADQLEENLLRSQKSTIESSLQSQDKKNESIFLKQERLVQRLRETSSPGRIAMDVISNQEEFKNSPHDLILEEGDRLLLPSTPSTVNVLGQVFNPNTLAWQPDFKPNDYLNATGGTTRSADKENIYILKANGRVVPFHQLSKGSFSWITGRKHSHHKSINIGPGDSILVPEDFEIKQNKLQVTKDISQIMFQIIGALGVVVAAF